MDIDETAGAAGPEQVSWVWHPPLPLETVPVLIWPSRPVAALKYLLSFAFLGSIIIPFGALAIIIWIYLQPALERCAQFHADWILQMYGRNLGLMILVAGGLHLYFYTFKRQGITRKFDPRDLERNNRKFFGNHQAWDNIFWSCVSGITIATVYEVFFMWSYANDLLPFYLDWKKHPIWFLFTVIAIPFWSSIHFYLIHRLLHWKPLYKLAHAVHHRNNNIGPWSGLSMHPIEHIIYLSGILIHVVVASHPVHIFFHTNWNTIGAAISHTGFESITFRGKPIFFLGSFHHQLHHRLYNCNYGNFLVRCDQWFGTDHDGTPEAWGNLQRRQHKKRPRAADNN